MDTFKAITKRASVRAFEPCDVPDEDLLKIVEAGRRAPSGYNRQPWHFIVVRDPDILGRLGPRRPRLRYSRTRPREQFAA